MASVVLENVTKVYAETVVAVDNMSIEIPHGEIVSLLGPSGCGKTTAMRLIAGFEDVDAGKIYVEGKDVTTWPPQRRNMSMVFQFPVVYDTMSVYDNIAMPLQALKHSKEDVRRLVEKACENFGIDKGMLKGKAKNLSISERQRLSLAHAFAVERNVNILDEPFSSIDPKSRIKLSKFVRDIQQKRGQTCIFVTHSQSEALTISDRIAMMRDGKLLQYTTPDEIYSRPKNKFVGWFLGNPGMNFIECVTKRKGDTLVLGADSFVALDRIPSEYIGKVTGEQPVTLGVRPENVDFSWEAKDGYIPCVCRFAEPVASRLLLNVKLGKDVNINVKVPMTHKVEVGDQIYIRFPEEKVMLFDVKTGDVL